MSGYEGTAGDVLPLRIVVEIPGRDLHMSRAEEGKMGRYHQ